MSTSSSTTARAVEVPAHASGADPADRSTLLTRWAVVAVEPPRLGSTGVVLRREGAHAGVAAERGTGVRQGTPTARRYRDLDVRCCPTVPRPGEETVSMLVVVGIDPHKADRIHMETHVLLHEAGASRPGDLLVRGTSRHHPARGGNRRLCDAQHRIAVTPTRPDGLGPAYEQRRRVQADITVRAPRARSNNASPRVVFDLLPDIPSTTAAPLPHAARHRSNP